MSEVSIKGLVKEYDGNRVLNGIDLDVAEGELLVLLGPSGCGKTTLLRCLAGLEEATDGELSIGGRPVDVPEQGAFVPPNKRGIGVVFQSYALWPHMTVRSNVSYALKLAKEKPEVIRQRVDEALQSLGILHRAEEYAGRLSGGQQQRVALARAIASRPRLMLFDEPLSNLDAKLRLKVRTDIRRLHRQSGITAVYVTHDQEEAMALGDRIVVMNQGVIQQVGTPEELYTSPTSTFVADFMGFDNIIGGSVRTDAGELFVSEGGDVRVPIAADAPSDANVVAIRATHLAVEPFDVDQTASGARMHGEVLARTYMGRYVELIVKVGDTHLLAHRPESDEVRWGRFHRGQQVIVSVDARSVIALNDPEFGGGSDTSTIRVELSEGLRDALRQDR